MLHQPRLVRLADITVPMPHGDTRRRAERRQPLKLVIDECLQRANVDAADGAGRALQQQGDDWKERRLRFPRRRGGSEEDVLLRPKDRLACRDLNPAQTAPILPVDVFTDTGRIAVKHVHRSNSANCALTSAPSTALAA